MIPEGAIQFESPETCTVKISATLARKMVAVPMFRGFEPVLRCSIIPYEKGLQIFWYDEYGEGEWHEFFVRAPEEKDAAGDLRLCFPEADVDSSEWTTATVRVDDECTVRRLLLF